MAEVTGIAWCDCTFNPWVGCTKVSSGCDHCYAEALDSRFGGGHWGPHAERRRTSPANWNQVRRWNRQAATDGVRRRVFCASLADVFDNQIDATWRGDLWNLIHDCDHLDWLLLTKRPQNIRVMLPPDWGEGWPNVWLGTSVENQTEADRRIPHLLGVPAAVRFLSCEPLLSELDIRWSMVDDCFRIASSLLMRGVFSPGAETLGPIDWVIVGGESGPGARPMQEEWAQSLRDQCAAARVAFFMKQMGGARNKRGEIEDFPETLRVRGWPNA